MRSSHWPLRGRAVSLRICHRLVSMLLTAHLVGAARTDGQVAPSSVTVLLAYSEVESVLSGYRARFEGHLVDLDVVLAPSVIAALDRHLSVEALLPILRSRLEAQGAEADLLAAATMVDTGAIGRVNGLMSSYAPRRTVEEYLRDIESSPPPEARVQLVAEVVRTQGAGEFFITLSERTREAAHRVAAAITPSAGDFRPITHDAWREYTQQSFAGAVLSFLHRYDGIPDPLLQAFLSDWRSEAGQWYVAAYSQALGETALVAAERIASELGPGLR